MAEKQIADNVFHWGYDSKGNAIIGGLPGYGAFTREGTADEPEREDVDPKCCCSTDSFPSTECPVHWRPLNLKDGWEPYEGHGSVTPLTTNKE